MKKQDLLGRHIRNALLDRSFLSAEGISREEMTRKTYRDSFTEMVYALADTADSRGRFLSKDILEIARKYTDELKVVPPEGWLEHCRLYVLNQLFPHLSGPQDPDKYRRGRVLLLQVMRGVYNYERAELPFDPTLDMHLLSDEEIRERGCTPEYIKMRRLIRSRYVYEFMRIGAETTPFNTLGHIGGVHYVAMFVARQLADAGVPVDLGLISGAAASHDIGKYGCRKEEERRVPYLHYYYTDYCLSRFALPTIKNIAANHSTWDLELENLSAESLLLIYADFRVKSSRDKDGTEIIHFYSLAEAFDVILNKLDNVDDAKRHRYVKVYNKLKDFEDFMIENGVTTVLPEDFAEEPAVKRAPAKRETTLLDGPDIISQMKFRAIDHNIRLMSRFNVPEDFAGLIEAARGETQWQDLRTYISILGEYSTYMTEEQKSITLRFLYEMLTHRESDIREQSAEIMGRIVGRYREEYKKELPKSVPAPDITGTNLYTFEKYLKLMLEPDHKYTEQHRYRIMQSTDFFVRSVVYSCRPSCRHRYFEIFERYFNADECDEMRIFIICSTMLRIDPDMVPESTKNALKFFTKDVLGSFTKSADLISLYVIEKYFGENPGLDITARRREILEVPANTDPSEAVLSTLFLDDLKLSTSWVVKLANIDFIMESLGGNVPLMHIATHLANLLKVSETVTVRRKAGDALLKTAERMPFEQRNELMIELFNGLELGDYQFTRFVPDYLGEIMLMVPPKELDETIYELEKLLNTGAGKSVSAALNTTAVCLEHYKSYDLDPDPKSRENRRKKLLGMLIKGISYYDSSISRDSFRILGRRIFESDVMTFGEKHWVAVHGFKRILSLLPEFGGDSGLEFYNNAAVLNTLYRFISEYITEVGDFHFCIPEKVAFFPGTFDPFSLGHKAIATTIRDMGYEVYLSIDEFSWSKKTLPHMLRQKILRMSIADEEGLNTFPDDISVNIANPDDLKRLRDIFAEKDLYIAMGSDVVMNASSYRKPPEEGSIHSMNHIIFARQARPLDADGEAYPITGDVISLKLPKYYEDISSSKIRENIDLGRDIMDLIDPVAQNYIYEMNFYTQEPTYKHVLQARELDISECGHTDDPFLEGIREELGHRGYNCDRLIEYAAQPDVDSVFIRTGTKTRKVSAFACAKKIETRELLDEFGSSAISSKIRKQASGGIALIGALYSSRSRSITNLGQMILCELMTSLLARDYTYAVYHPVDPAGMDRSVIDVLERQGFVNISPEKGNPVYAVDMREPIVIFRDVETVIKAPLNKNPRVMKAIDDAHLNLLKTFTELFPGRLIVSFNTNATYSKIIDLVTKENGVSKTPDPERHRGPYMAVPFGKALSDIAIPNTVTKTLRTEKYFNNEITDFTIRETYNYQPLEDQIRTIKSFDRPVILIDDLLHKAHRLNLIDPILRRQNVEIHKIIVGLMTGNALDNMKEHGREVDSAYFIPTIKMWLNERDCYPFIGGDSIDLPDGSRGEASVNLIMPYTSFNFVGRDDMEKVYRYSMTCLQNAHNILTVLEQEYQQTYEKKLTLRRLGAVITHPRRPIAGLGLVHDDSVAPSAFVDNAIRITKRLHLVKK
jgi:nicotinic acid mononucleotide adenylyltransferase